MIFPPVPHAPNILCQHNLDTIGAKMLRPATTNIHNIHFISAEIIAEHPSASDRRFLVNPLALTLYIYSFICIKTEIQNILK